MSGKKKSLLLAMVVLTVSSTAAIAATTWTDIIGTSGDDTINKSNQPGNYRIYGLAGQDTLTGGQGDNVLVGDGHCPPGSTTVEYCDTAPIPGDAGDTLRGGGGNNVLIGGGGPNHMYGGHGNNYIQAGSSTNWIWGGPTGDTINATNGTSSYIYPGTGTNYIDTRGPGIERVICNGTQDTVYADANDIVRNCAHVYVNRGRDYNGAASLRKHRHGKHARRHSPHKRR